MALISQVISHFVGMVSQLSGGSSSSRITFTICFYFGPATEGPEVLDVRKCLQVLEKIIVLANLQKGVHWKITIFANLTLKSRFTAAIPYFWGWFLGSHANFEKKI